MKQIIHRISAVIATLCIVTFFISTLIVEFFGTVESIQMVKGFIVMPGLFILIPAIASTGITGFLLSKGRTVGLIGAKRKRMPFIGANGILILLPAAIILEQWASAGNFDAKFYTLQAVELIAAAINISLMFLNIRDGRKLSK